MAEVKVQNICKFFESGKPILRDISFTVGDCEFVTLLGPSGCGKTTLLRIIAGLERQTSGSIAIGGSDMTDVSPRDRDMAFVFQTYALYPHFTVWGNIELGLKLRKIPSQEIDKRVRETAAKLGIEKLLSRKPRALSGGQRQRVALARALVRSPRAFLLDEPLSNLDALLRDKTRGELKLLFKRVGGTVVYVTHDQIEAMTMSDRIILLNNGDIQQIGTPEEIYSRPANSFTAGFIGTPPMNIFSRADALNLRLSLPEQMMRRENFLCGIRPENIAVSDHAEDGYERAAVLIAEPTGSSTILSIESNKVFFRCVTSVKWKAKQKDIWFYFDPGHLHFFDASDGKRI